MTSLGVLAPLLQSYNFMFSCFPAWHLLACRSVFWKYSSSNLFWLRQRYFWIYCDLSLTDKSFYKKRKKTCFSKLSQVSLICPWWPFLQNITSTAFTWLWMLLMPEMYIDRYWFQQSFPVSAGSFLWLEPCLAVLSGAMWPLSLCLISCLHLPQSCNLMYTW